MVREHNFSALGKFFYAAVFILAFSVLVSAAPYNGEQFDLLQPDGTYVTVNVFGDEYFQRIETPDGYTLVKDPVTKWICYARLSADGTKLESTGTAYNPSADSSGTQAAPVQLPPEKHIELPADVVAKQAYDTKRELDSLSSSVSPAGLPQAAPNPPQRIGSYVGLTLLIDFPDNRATISSAEINNFCNQIGYTGYSNNGSVRDYYKEASNNKLDYTNYVSAYYTARYNKSYYTDESISYGQRARELIVEALQYLDSQGFNFTTVSTSGGSIIAINAFYAGNADNAWSKGLWPHASSMGGWFSADGVNAGAYQITNIGSSLSTGTFIHENGHMLLGWPDLYDYDYDSTGAGNYCVMAYGGSDKNKVLPNPYFRFLSGWETITNISSATNAVFTQTSNSIASLKYVNPSNSNEMFFLEARNKTGRNASYPDAGLVIWHVDGNGSNNNNQMTSASHFMVSVEQADAANHLETNSNYGDANDLWDNTKTSGFTDATAPNSKWWNGSASGLRVTNISAPGSSMSFTIGNGGATPTNTPTPFPGSGTGLCGSYYNNMSLSGNPCASRVDSQVNFDWAANNPGLSCIPVDLFSVRWSGEIQAPYSGTWTFYLRSDDGARLYVNNTLIIDKWIDQSATEWSGTYSMTAGTKYAVRIEYFENGGDAVCQLSWEGPNVSKQVVPQNRLYNSGCGPTNTPTFTNTPTRTFTFTNTYTSTPTATLTPTAPPALGNGLCGSYFANMALTGDPCAYRLDSQVNFDWAANNPGIACMPVDLFSVRWNGEIEAPYSGTWTFYLRGDDGIRLYVNNTLVIDKWIDQSATEWSGTYAMTAGTKYQVRVEFYENGGDAVCQFLWEGPNTAKQAVPQGRLYSVSCGVTNTPTFTFTNTSTFTNTFTRTPTRTFTDTFTATVTLTPTNTFTITNTATVTETATITPTFTESNTFTVTNTATATNTATNSFTTTNTPVFTSTFTATVTATPTRTFTNTFTRTNTLTPTNTNSPTRTNTFTFTNTNTNTPTRTLTPTQTPTTAVTNSKLNLQVRNANLDSCTDGNFKIEYKIINNTGAAFDLSKLKVKAWLNNAEAVLFVNCDWVRAYNSAGTATGTYATATNADASMTLCSAETTRKANQVRTLSFSTLSIPAGGYATVVAWYWRGGYTPFDVGCDDYSKPGATTFHEDKYFGLYENNKIMKEYTSSTTIDALSGVEPCGASPIAAHPNFTPEPTETPVTPESTQQEISKILPYPNPVNPDSAASFKVRFNLGQSTGRVSFKLFTTGRKLIRQEEFNNTFAPGENELEISSEYVRDVANGLYLFLIIAEDAQGNTVKSDMGKLLIMR